MVERVVGQGAYDDVLRREEYGNYTVRVDEDMAEYVFCSIKCRFAARLKNSFDSILPSL